MFGPVLWLAGCQEPFAEDRHDLTGFRIAAVEVAVSDTATEVAPRAAVVVDGRAWASETASLDWYQLVDEDAVEAIDAATPIDASGPDPTLPVRGDRPVLVLIARHAGLEERAFAVLDPPVEAPAIAGVSAVESVPVGGVVTMTAEVGPPGGVVHWMATAGTFYELSPLVTEWTAEVAVERPVTFIALLLGEEGGTSWHAREIHVGAKGPGLWIDQRWMPTDVAVTVEPGDAVEGTLVADDRSPIGVALVGPTVLPAEGIEWGTSALSCATPLDGPFDPDWLLRQICGRDAVAGHRVAVLAEVAR
jgi:hypothetical protein